MKARLQMMHDRKRIDKKDQDPNRPRLRRAPGSGTTIDNGNGGNSGSTGNDDDRPTLKRRPDSDQP